MDLQEAGCGGMDWIVLVQDKLIIIMIIITSQTL
jgi:hypothetical protein